MFVLWGLLHGVALVIHREWRRMSFSMPRPLAWFLTFNYINFTWIFFRANSMEDALRIIKGMADIDSLHLKVSQIATTNLAWGGKFSDYLISMLPNGIAANIFCFVFIIAGFIVTTQKNSFALMMGNLGYAKISAALILFCLSMYAVMVKTSTVFLYYTF
jgi:alginate O-acetyltransferase complex protein AlgI